VHGVFVAACHAAALRLAEVAPVLRVALQGEDRARAEEAQRLRGARRPGYRGPGLLPAEPETLRELVRRCG
jgi:hypothetical protein